VDTNGDLVAEIAYRVRFAPAGDGALTATVRRVEGPDASGRGEGGEIIVQGAPVSTGRVAQVTEASAYCFFAGWRSDPFFFDAGGALNNLQFTGRTPSPIRTYVASSWSCPTTLWAAPRG
jgi:hypothetical protein